MLGAEGFVAAFPMQLNNCHRPLIKIRRPTNKISPFSPFKFDSGWIPVSTGDIKFFECSARIGFLCFRDHYWRHLVKKCARSSCGFAYKSVGWWVIIMHWSAYINNVTVYVHIKGIVKTAHWSILHIAKDKLFITTVNQ